MVDKSDDRRMQSDSPLESFDEDKLGYSNFTNYLADAITTRVPTGGFTIGIYGQWGSGKSTILEFVEQSLRETDENPIIVRFNPWWFSGQGDLFQMFFEELAIALGKDSNLPEIKDKINRLSMSLSELPLEMVGIPSGVLRGLGKWTESDQTSIHELKDDISDSLEESDRPIIVMIDDMDRLTSEEVSQMFQLVKSIADFPNMTYILAFDEDVIVNALQDEQGEENGREYLEKIIQLPVQVPVPREGSLEDLIVDHLADVAGDRHVDMQRFRTLLRDGILPTLNTPRDTTRLANAIEFSHAPVKDEVNFVDLVGIELLKMFYKDIYGEIRTDPDRFVGIRRALQQQHTEEDDFEDILPDKDERRGPAEATLRVLFPKVASHLTSTFSSGTQDRRHRTNKRICHPDRYRVYFRLDLPQGMISWEKMQKILESTVDKDDFTTQIISLLHEDSDEQPQVAEFIDRLRDHQEEIRIDNIPNIIHAFLTVGDQIVGTDGVSSSAFNRIEVQIVSLLLSLIQRWGERKSEQTEDEKVDVLKSAIENGDSPYLSTELTVRLLRDQGEYGSDPLSEEDRVIGMEQIEELKEATGHVIERHAEEDQLLSVPDPMRVLKYWPDFTQTDAPKKWAERNTESDDEFIDLLFGFVASSSLRSSASVGVTEQFYVDPRWLEPYLELENVRDRVENYDIDKLDNTQQNVVNTYRTAWEYLEEGQDPGSAETWHFTLLDTDEE